jgi:hypothetical protein
MHMSVTGGERSAGQRARPQMTIISIILSSLTRIETALSSLDKAIRAVGERMNRRTTNSRWMNG